MSDALTDSSAPLQAHVENGIGFVALNRPKALNALSSPMIDAMRAALGAWRDDPGVRALRERIVPAIRQAAVELTALLKDVRSAP